MTKKFMTIFFLLSMLIVSPQVWAGEASFFDDILQKTVRAYESNGTVSIHLLDRGSLTVSAGYTIQCGSQQGNPVVVATGAQSDISLAYNTAERVAYVFYKNINGNISIAACSISSSSAPPPQTYSISGKVTMNSSPLSAVTVRLNGQSSSVQTNTAGDYIFNNLQNGSYTVTPERAGTTFTPQSTNVNINGSNLTGINFSATGGSNVDLIISSLFHSSPGYNSQPFSITLAARNQGSLSAGTFKVKVYFSEDAKVSSSDKLLLTWDINGLAAGAQVSKTFSNIVFSGASLHSYYYFIAVADADNQVIESNEANNGRTTSVYVAR